MLVIPVQPLPDWYAGGPWSCSDGGMENARCVRCEPDEPLFVIVAVMSFSPSTATWENFVPHARVRSGGAPPPPPPPLTAAYVAVKVAPVAFFGAVTTRV